MNLKTMKSEQNITEFDVPNGAKYGGYPITEIGYNHEMDRVYIIYEGDDLLTGWDQLIFGAEWNDNPKINQVPPGLVSPQNFPIEEKSPGAKESEYIYDLLEELGIEVIEYK